MKLDPIVLTMIKAGWLGMLLGVLSGAIIGLFFHREDWMGGYGSYRRRLTRLGHISFFWAGVGELLLCVHPVRAADKCAVGFGGDVGLPHWCGLDAGLLLPERVAETMASSVRHPGGRGACRGSL